jgi:hypothetical protein
MTVVFGRLDFIEGSGFGFVHAQKGADSEPKKDSDGAVRVARIRYAVRSLFEGWSLVESRYSPQSKKIGHTLRGQFH